MGNSLKPMHTVRLTQSLIGEDKYRVEISLEGDGPRRTATTEFSYVMTPQEQENIRWYLEDYLQNPHDPAPTIAADVEQRMAEIGSQLFEAVFRTDDDAREIWSTIKDDLSSTRFEIITTVQEATAIPWELMRDSRSDTLVALSVLSFVRASHQASRTPVLPQTEAGPIRILLVICRPRAGSDVPFRSVANRLIKSLDETTRETFDLVVLRPPTFEQLAEELRRAREEGKPYHIVHFDGHGAYMDKKSASTLAGITGGLSSIALSGPKDGKHGYLLFENLDSEENIQPVGGTALGKLLRETETPVLLLNACQSAYAEPPEQPEKVGAKNDIHEQVRLYGSLAQEVMDAGAAGVVAMRYTVYVVTAAQFVADLYSHLVQGHNLGQAVTLGRKNLSENPVREIGYRKISLQDWSVPIVYEAAPIDLFPMPLEKKEIHLEVPREGQIIASSEATAGGLPRPPDAGFFGRDETLLALDRAFDRHQVVLLQGYAGSGKTQTAAEFARWYYSTGGVKDGAVMFTSFEQHTPLVRALDQIGQVFGQFLEQQNVPWLTLKEDQRRNVALQLLGQKPVLWIWDNVEQVAGFPKGAESKWSKDEQNELFDFLKDASTTKAKILLTSRRDERDWLHDLPHRIAVPPMPPPERLDLARAVASKYQPEQIEMHNWRPLLRYSDGNPLTITVLVGQAVRAGLKSRDEIEEFVEKIRSGETEIEDDETQGRTRSLAASLRYGFEDAFTEDERKILAVLHLFQGFVDVDALKLMGDPDNEWCLPELKGLTREVGIPLLDRAAEVGLLTAHGGGYYSIHPALPWFFTGLFDQYYPDEPEQSPAMKATRAYVETIGALGNYFQHQYEGGNNKVVGTIALEEANLLHARHLALANSWWNPILDIMTALYWLNDHHGRQLVWKRLVEVTAPYFVVPETDGPIPGREEQWPLMAQFRVRLAQSERKYAKALRIQTTLVEFRRQRAGPFLEFEPSAWNASQRNDIRSLESSLGDLADIQRHLSSSDCIKSYRECLSLSERIGEARTAAIRGYNLGLAYKDIAEVKDLDEAARSFKHALRLCGQEDRMGRSKCMGGLGSVALSRYDEAVKLGRPPGEINVLLQQSLTLYLESLDLTPADAISDLAVSHHQLGNTYQHLREFREAKAHYDMSIRYQETQGNVFGAGEARRNVAIMFANTGQFTNALLYAEAALRNFETYGEHATENIEKTKGLIAYTEGLMKQKEGGGDG